ENSGFRMFARCPGDPIQRSTTPAPVFGPYATFSPHSPPGGVSCASGLSPSARYDAHVHERLASDPLHDSALLPFAARCAFVAARTAFETVPPPPPPSPPPPELGRRACCACRAASSAARRAASASCEA